MTYEIRGIRRLSNPRWDVATVLVLDDEGAPFDRFEMFKVPSETTWTAWTCDILLGRKDIRRAIAQECSKKPLEVGRQRKFRRVAA